MSLLAVVYSREIDGRVLTFAISGWLYRRTFVLYDFETESLWYPLGEAGVLLGIGGAHAGRKLPALPSMLIRWNAWKYMYPDTDYLYAPGTPSGE